MTPVGGWHDALSAQKLIFVFDNYVLDTGRRELRCGYTVVSVQPQVFDLLEYLIRNRGHVISRDDLLDAVWGGRIVSESTLATRINAARSAIGDDGESQRLIRTLPRKGIRFVGDVREEEEEEQPRARRATDVTFEDAGDQKLTNITRPARAYRAQPAKSAGTALALPDKPSVAVLSFKNMSDDPKQQYFADGMADDIITGLSRIKWLFVIARNSSFTYKDRAIDVKQVGRELGVRYVLQGSVRKAGDRVRITGQLVDVATGAHIWADRSIASSEVRSPLICQCRPRPNTKR
jgi:TolB-like protein/DNA-binding winged helix-turn-helix (wHTH) protein